ncbi:unknown [Prevotella sp. CAG:873]|nr:unknown [Prevotella sp. CAG:873]
MAFGHNIFAKFNFDGVALRMIGNYRWAVNFLRSVTAIATRTSIGRSVNIPIRHTIECFALYALGFLTFCPQSSFLCCTFLSTATSLCVLCATPFCFSTLFCSGNLLPMIEDSFCTVADSLSLGECIFGGILRGDTFCHCGGRVILFALLRLAFLCLVECLFGCIEVFLTLRNDVGHNFGGCSLVALCLFNDSIPSCVGIGFFVFWLSLLVDRNTRQSRLLRFSCFCVSRNIFVNDVAIFRNIFNIIVACFHNGFDKRFRHSQRLTVV